MTTQFTITGGGSVERYEDGTLCFSRGMSVVHVPAGDVKSLAGFLESASGEHMTGAMTAEAYQEQALRTVYPDLTFYERLGLCGHGLSGETGEVNDLLKKYLYHRNGKPLDIDKLKEELGDVLWYIALLCSTLDLPLTEVMSANIAKNEKRHPNGFTPRYASDSHTSE